MPASIDVDPDTGLAIATCSGSLRLVDAQTSVIAFWSTPGWLGNQPSPNKMHALPVTPQSGLHSMQSAVPAMARKGKALLR